MVTNYDTNVCAKNYLTEDYQKKVFEPIISLLDPIYKHLYNPATLVFDLQYLLKYWVWEMFNSSESVKIFW